MTPASVALARSTKNAMVSKTNLLWIIAGVIITAFFFLPIFSQDYQDYAIGLIEKSPYLAPVIIIIFRFIGVVVAPLPGAPIAFASMAVMPWHQAWAYNFIGSVLGAITAFWIARKFREPVVARFVSLEKIHKWQEKISHKRQFWGFAGLRFVSVIAFDFVSYAAGLTKISFRTFIGATFLIDIPVSLMFFYVGGQAVKYSIFLFGGFIVLFIITGFLWSKVWRKNI